MFFCIRELFRPGRRASRGAGGGKDTRPPGRRCPARRRPVPATGRIRRAGLAAALAVPAALAPVGPLVADAPPARADAPAPPVAVASSLRFAWPILTASVPGVPPVRASFGASLTLAGQMLAGAPFELLVAADVESVERLVAGGLVDRRDVARYADGRLALAVRTGSPLAPAPTLEALAALLGTDPSSRIAIPNPASAPYGRAALEALDSAGLGALSPRRVARGESAGQALQFLLAGAVDAALVPRSLTVGAPPGTDVAAAPIDAARHAPIRHALGAVRDAGPAARLLARALRSCAARTALEAQGLDPPAGVACLDGEARGAR